MDEMSFVDKEYWTWSSEAAGFKEFSDRTVIIDSGTSFNLLPQSDLRKMLEVLSEQTGIKCAAWASSIDFPKCTCTKE
jgi:hypothetical protein